MLGSNQRHDILEISTLPTELIGSTKQETISLVLMVIHVFFIFCYWNVIIVEIFLFNCFNVFILEKSIGSFVIKSL